MPRKNVKHPYVLLRPIEPNVNQDGRLRYLRPNFNRNSESLFLPRAEKDLQGSQANLISFVIVFLNMNNPFLTDRNIFSKVVNPIKKR